MLYQLISKLLAKKEKIFHCYCYEVKAHSCVFHASFICPDKELMNDKNLKLFLENKGIDHEYN